MTKWMVEAGMTRSQRKAGYILILLSVLGFLTTFIILFSVYLPKHGHLPPLPGGYSIPPFGPS